MSLWIQQNLHLTSPAEGLPASKEKEEGGKKERKNERKKENVAVCGIVPANQLLHLALAIHL
jgi:hypothetical protein